MTQAAVFEMCVIIDDYIETVLQEAIDDADVQQAQHLIITLSGMLSAIGDSCAEDYVSMAEVPDECINSLVRRQGLRFRLLLKLDNANLTQTLTATTLMGQTTALASITEKTLEMDLNLRSFAVRFVRKALLSVYAHASIETEAIAQTYAQVLHNIVVSTKAEASPLYVTTRRSLHSLATERMNVERLRVFETERLHRRAIRDSRRLPRGVGAGWDEGGGGGLTKAVAEEMEEDGEEGWKEIYGRRVGAVTLPRDVLTARDIIEGSLKAMSGISGVSTRRHVHGQNPAILTVDSYVCKTQRVSVSQFAGLIISDPAQSIIVQVPVDLFERRIGEATEEVDIMLTVWDFNTPPIPPPQGFSGTIKEDFLSVVVSLEVREAGSDELIKFTTLQTPIVMRINTPRTVDTSKDYSTGRGLVAAPMFWSWPEWKWVIEGTRSIGSSQGSAGMVVTAEASRFEHLAVIVKMAGCDSIPQSDKVT